MNLLRETYAFIAIYLFLQALPAYGVLIHQYSFNESSGETVFIDSIGGENAELINSGFAQVGDNGSVTLDGGTRRSYIDIPTATIQNSESISTELWATNNSHRNNSRIFELGSSKTERITWHWAGYRNSESYFQAVGFDKNGSTSYDVYEKTTDALELGTEYHFTLTLEDIGNDLRVSIFLDSVLVSTNLLTNSDISDLEIDQFTLGYDSFYGSSASSSSYNELRIHNHALTQEQITQNYQYGSGVVPEPSTYALIFGVVAFCAVMRLRHQSSIDERK